MTAGQIALVEWEDAAALDEHLTWVPVEDAQWKSTIVRSVGFVLYDGPEGIVLTDSVMQGCTGQRHQIPRGMVRRVQILAASQRRNQRAKPTGET